MRAYKGIVENGVVVVLGTRLPEGETVVIADTEAAGSVETPLFGDVVTYELLCRRHYNAGVVT